MNNEILKKTTPEEIGLSTAHVRNFINQLHKRGIHMHSVIGIRHNKVFFEGYYAPFTKDKFHRMYSVSKSFVAGAIGLLLDEGRISLDDKVASYFTDILPEDPHPYIMEATVRNLLMMSSPHRGTTHGFDSSDWVRSFFTTVPSHPAGTLFNYDTSASLVLNALVERVTGKPFLEYMKDKMLRETGFSENAYCIKTPDGYSWGGSGVLCTPMDLARYALIYLNGGKWGEKQLISKEFIDAATSNQISTYRSSGIDPLSEGYGYGYYTWRIHGNGFAFLGMGEQMALCYPEHDFLFVCTADGQGHSSVRASIMELLYSNIIENFNSDPIEDDPDAVAELNKQLESLSLPVPCGTAHSPIESKINGVKFALDGHNRTIEEFSLIFEEDHGAMKYRNSVGEKEIVFGLGKYKKGYFPEYYSGDTMLTPSERYYESQTCGVWVDEQNFLIRIDVVDNHIGNSTMLFSFTDDGVILKINSCAEGFLEEYDGIRKGKPID